MLTKPPNQGGIRNVAVETASKKRNAFMINLPADQLQSTVDVQFFWKRRHFTIHDDLIE